jgi:resuscitation-promoting factor RpfB
MSERRNVPAGWTLWKRPGSRTKQRRLVACATALIVALAVAVLSGCTATTATSDPTKDAPAQVAKPAAKPKSAAVPRLVGLTLAEVKVALRDARLTIGVVERQPSAKEAGTVLRQGTSPGSSLDRGSPVTVVLAAPLPKIPSVVGSTKAAAINALEAAGFRVQISTKSTTSGEDNVAVSESPSDGTRAKPGTVVTLVIADLHKPPTLSPASNSNCTPGYTPCLPPASDYDCEGGSGDGPKYTGLVHVTGSDPYALDVDGDGVGCDR